MTASLKVLGQVVPAVTTLTDLYTVPSATSTTVSTLNICNQNNAIVNVRVSVAVAGAADDPKQYILYNCQLSAYDSFSLTIGMTLAATDKIRVYSDTANVSFNVFGVENS